jgi:hypothetical protein
VCYVLCTDVSAGDRTGNQMGEAVDLCDQCCSDSYADFENLCWLAIALPNLQDTALLPLASMRGGYL